MTIANSPTPHPEPPPGGKDKSRSALTWRSLGLGLIGVLFICGLSPYNDYVLRNTYLVGNYLPIGLLLFFLMVVMLINAPLSRYAPRRALGGGELAVALGMALVSCTVPASGLMRYLPSSLVISYFHAGENREFLRLMEEARPADWLFPKFAHDEPALRVNDPLAIDFWGRAFVEEPTFTARWRAVPWRAWARPAVTWGVFIAAFYGAVLCMMVIVRRQWVENERLPFPLATIWLSLIETPRPGQWLNTLFRSRGFWVACVAVFALHGINAMSRYDPQVWPQIPVWFNLTQVFADTPLRFAEHSFMASTLFFSVVGITFFLQTKVAFSLWFFYAAFQFVRIGYGSYGDSFTLGMETDQRFGAAIPFVLMVLWIGRRHWAMVARQMFRPPREGEPRGRYLPYAVAGWGFVACVVAMLVWLVLAGMTVGGALFLLVMLLSVMLVMARLVAETGLMYLQLPLPLYRPWVYALQELPAALSFRSTTTNYFFSGWFHQLFGHDTREALSPFASTAIRVADDTVAQEPHDSQPTRAIAFFAALVLALAAAYVVSGAAMLYVQYSHANTVDQFQEAPVNPWGLVGSIHLHMLAPPADLLPPREGPHEAHSRKGHFAFGLSFTAMLSVLRLRYEAWPFHPVGYLLAFTHPMRMIWFSILVGWAAKALVVKFGGVDLYRRGRLVFLGLIIGEAGAAGVWVIIGILLHAMGMEYQSIRLLPG